MSGLPAKPGTRHSVSEWCRNNHQLYATAEHERHISTLIRQEARSLRNDTSCTTTFDEWNTSQLLGERVVDIARWKEVLETCAKKVDEEMEALTLSKQRTEQALAATTVPLEVSLDCVKLRDGRQGYELVTDPVDEELRKETELIKRVQQVLQQHIDKAFEQLEVLQGARHQLTSDLQNKMKALDIDISCLSLTIKSPEISLKNNVTNIPPGSITPQEWVQFSHSNVVRAEEAMTVSQQIRSDMSLTRAQLQNEIETQQRATDFILRKRNHNEEQARSELERQIKYTESEMLDMESDIQQLEADMQAKTASVKLAHTRLENRTNRPGMDLCRDDTQHSLVIEVQQLEATIRTLKQKLSEAHHSLQRMKAHHTRMVQDLYRKQEALSLEERSMKTRTRLSLAASFTDQSPALMVPLANSSGRSNLQLLPL